MILIPLGLHGSQVRFFIAYKMTIVIGVADREQVLLIQYCNELIKGLEYSILD